MSANINLPIGSTACSEYSWILVLCINTISPCPNGISITGGAFDLSFSFPSFTLNGPNFSFRGELLESRLVCLPIRGL